ncbi:MAG: proteinase inhibitor i78 [Asticcacaulis sp.]
MPLAILGLAGCSSGPGPAPSPQGPTTFHPEPETPPPGQSIRPSAPLAAQTPDYHPMADDQCGAAALQYLIGKPRTEIPVPLDPGQRRVVCSTCIITQDFRADRQTITFDTDTGLIKSVKCG